MPYPVPPPEPPSLVAPSRLESAVHSAIQLRSAALTMALAKPAPPEVLQPKFAELRQADLQNSDLQNFDLPNSDLQSLPPEGAAALGGAVTLQDAFQSLENSPQGSQVLTQSLPPDSAQSAPPQDTPLPPSQPPVVPVAPPASPAPVVPPPANSAPYSPPSRPTGKCARPELGQSRNFGTKGRSPRLRRTATDLYRRGQGLPQVSRGIADGRSLPGQFAQPSYDRRGQRRFDQGDQILRGQRFRYNLIQEEGTVEQASGEIFLPTTATDFNPNLPTDITSGTVPRGSVGDRVFANQPQQVTSGGSANVTLGSRRNSSGALLIPQNGGQVRRLRFEAEQISFYPEGWQAKNVRITNDPYSPPELELRTEQAQLRKLSPLRDEVVATRPVSCSIVAFLYRCCEIASF
ncbi:MAG: DUF3769 domain-containing protein [Leptolyngbyaceae cyanobacterium SU_3_3]|nr:DUF3769 domain-containing protein [Leptolyngbyaceae cyanobacterium SU_3_3]